MARTHHVFISYHHTNDEGYRKKLEKMARDEMINGSVMDGDINPDVTPETIRRIIRENYLRDTTVTIVLVGEETWKRKHIDWEIYSSLHRSGNKSRSGLLGIMLPTHENYQQEGYNQYLIPPRLHDNIECGYAELIDWTTDANFINRRINAAFNRRYTYDPDLSRPLFIKNRCGDRWYC